MNIRDQVDGWLKELSKKIGSPLSLEENGVCVFSYGEDIECTVEVPEGSAMVYLYCPILDLSNLDEKEKERLFKRLLALNFFGFETGGAVFGLDEERNRIILWFGFYARGIDSLGFENILGNFLSFSEKWKSEIGKLGQAETLEEKEPPFSSTEDLRFKV